MKNISISEILKMLYDLTGMRVTVYNTSFRSIISYPGYQITYCKELQKCKDFLAVCRRADKESFESVSGTKKVLNYNCPFGLMEIVTRLFLKKKSSDILL